MIFDRPRQLYLKQKALQQNVDSEFFFLYREIELILEERLSFFKQNFPRILISGLTSQDFKNSSFFQKNGQDLSVSLDSFAPSFADDNNNNVAFHALKGDEENLPFEVNSFDLIVSCLQLHHLNRVPETLFQCHHMLKSSGLYLSAFLGGETLYELRTCLMQAELEITKGAKPRIHPMISLETALHLFTSASFKEPLVDRQRFTLTYSCLKTLFKEMKDLGESNSLIQRARTPLHRSILQRAEEIYQNTYANPEGELCVTVEVIFLTGWA